MSKALEETSLGFWIDEDGDDKEGLRTFWRNQTEQFVLELDPKLVLAGLPKRLLVDP